MSVQDEPEFFIQIAPEVGSGPQLQSTGGNLIAGSRDRLEAAAELAGRTGASLKAVFEELRPDKGTVEFAVTFEADSGIPVIAKGKATASLTVTLEWDSSKT